MIALTRRYCFPAAHLLRHPALSDRENEDLYGKCANPNGHGHNYRVEVTVSGPLDPVTGRIVDPDQLDAIVGERVLERFGHRLLNDDPAFRERVPTAERVALLVREELDAPVSAETTARVVRVRVVETYRNTFECGDPR